MSNIYVYLIDLPACVNESIISGVDSFTIYINKNLSESKRIDAFNHALRHIEMGHFDIDCDKSVQEMEYEAHYGKEEKK